MLSEALNKLQEALEIIDMHDAHLSGIHVANAIEALSSRISEANARPETGRTSNISSH